MMRRLPLLLLLLALPARAQEELPSLTIMADANLALPLAAVARDYARERQSAVALIFTRTTDISAQIAEGSSADVLITLRQNAIEELKQQGLTDVYSEKTVAQDRLVLVGPADSPVKMADAHFPTAGIITAMGGEAHFLIGHPEAMPEAGLVREGLRKLQADADLEPYTLYMKDRKLMARMIREEGAYGVMLASDAAGWGLHVLGTLPKQAHSPAEYHAVVLAGDNMAYARQFIDYLQRPGVQKSLQP